MEQLQIRGWKLSDVGCVRQQNEDACFLLEEENLLLGIVCDGMGGANAGEVASRIAAKIFSKTVLETEDTPEERMRVALERANRAVYQHSWMHSDCRGMGTTLVAVLILDGTAYILNAGDSRCYASVKGRIFQITRDHSLVEELVRSGSLTPEQARYHPNRNIITRALGTDRSIAGDLFIHKLQPDELLLLCSDGLSNELTDNELCEQLVIGPPEEACQRLIRSALDRGARDNVTALVIAVQERKEL